MPPDSCEAEESVFDLGRQDLVSYFPIGRGSPTLCRGASPLLPQCKLQHLDPTKHVRLEVLRTPSLAFEQRNPCAHLGTLNLPLIAVAFPSAPFGLQIMKHACEAHWWGTSATGRGRLSILLLQTTGLLLVLLWLLLLLLLLLRERNMVLLKLLHVVRRKLMVDGLMMIRIWKAWCR